MKNKAIKIVIKAVSCIVVSTFLTNTIAYGLAPMPGSNCPATRKAVYAVGEKLFGAEVGPGSIDFTPTSFAKGDELQHKRDEAVNAGYNTRFTPADYNNPPEAWDNNPILKETDLIEALKIFRDNEAKIPAENLEIRPGILSGYEAEGKLPTSKLKQIDGNKYVLIVDKRFVSMWNHIRENDVWFEITLESGEKRTVSAAWGIFYRLAKHEMSDLKNDESGYKNTGHLTFVEDKLLFNDSEIVANMIGGNYHVVNDAIWLWFLAAYCFRDTTRYSNETLYQRINWIFDDEEAVKLRLGEEFPYLDFPQGEEHRLFETILVCDINSNFFNREGIKVPEITLDESFVTEYKEVENSRPDPASAAAFPNMPEKAVRDVPPAESSESAKKSFILSEIIDMIWSEIDRNPEMNDRQKNRYKQWSVLYITKRRINQLLYSGKLTREKIIKAISSYARRRNIKREIKLSIAISALWFGVIIAGVVILDKGFYSLHVNNLGGLGGVSLVVGAGARACFRRIFDRSRKKVFETILTQKLREDDERQPTSAAEQAELDAVTYDYDDVAVMVEREIDENEGSLKKRKRIKETWDTFSMAEWSELIDSHKTLTLQTVREKLNSYKKKISRVNATDVVLFVMMFVSASMLASFVYVMSTLLLPFIGGANWFAIGGISLSFGTAGALLLVRAERDKHGRGKRSLKALSKALENVKEKLQKLPESEAIHPALAAEQRELDAVTYDTAAEMVRRRLENFPRIGEITSTPSRAKRLEKRWLKFIEKERTTLGNLRGDALFESLRPGVDEHFGRVKPITSGIVFAAVGVVLFNMLNTFLVYSGEGIMVPVIVAAVGAIMISKLVPLDHIGKKRNAFIFDALFRVEAILKTSWAKKELTLPPGPFLALKEPTETTIPKTLPAPKKPTETTILIPAYGEGPGAEDLTLPETENVYVAATLLKQEKIELFIPQAFQLTEKMQYLIKGIEGKSGRNIIYRIYSDFKRLSEMLELPPKGKRMVITVDVEIEEEFELTPYVDRNPTIFQQTRFINMTLPAGYAQMRQRAKIICQAKIITIAILARLLDGQNTPKVKMFLRHMLEDSLMGPEEEVDKFIEILGDPRQDENLNKGELVKRILLLVSYHITLIEKIARKYRLMKVFLRSL